MPSDLEITFFVFKGRIFIKEKEISSILNTPNIQIKTRDLKLSSIHPNNPFLTDLREQEQLIRANYNPRTREVDISIDNFTSHEDSNHMITTDIAMPLGSDRKVPPFPFVDQIRPDLDLPDNFDEIPESELHSPGLIPLFNLSELPYRPTTFLGPQPLMYLSFGILGKQIKALFDSGASRSFIGLGGLKLIKDLNLKIVNKKGRVQVANSQIELVSKEIIAPVKLQNHTKSIAFRVLKTLPVAFAVGLDFLKIFKINVDFDDRVWTFKDSTSQSFTFEKENSFSENCSGLRELSTKETDLLSRFLDRELPEPTEKPGLTNLTEHVIDVGSHPPIKQRYYLVSPKVMQDIVTEVDKMLDHDIIEPSNSSWSSPIVMAKKADGTRRFCLDFRKLNQVTKKDAYPLPQMNGILDKLRSAKYISKIDLLKGFHQIPLENGSREKTAFTVPGRGLFQFKRMPFGLTNAPATFQRLLDKIIGPEMEPHAFAYLDDIIIVTKTFDEHLQWLSKVLNKIKVAGLEINRKKCEFCCSQVHYLGFLVNENGLQTDPDKIDPILKYPVPRNIKDLRRFLGLASWYRRFIPNYATLATPLTKLLKKTQSWIWHAEQQSAYEEIKLCLSDAPVLACPDFEIPFVLQTDASNTGLGAVLTQTVRDEEHVISYASRTLSEAEIKYSTTEKECLAIVWAIQKYRPYLEGYKFTVVTDHSSLRWLHNLKNPTGRLARWSLSLLEYDFDILHRKGSQHHVPDALSRMFESQSLEEIYLVKNSVSSWYDRRFCAVTEFPERFPAWKISGEKLYHYRPNSTVTDFVDDLNGWKLVPKDNERQSILQEAHDDPQSGHLGTQKTNMRVSLRYYWPGYFRDVNKYVRSCTVCQDVK